MPTNRTRRMRTRTGSGLEPWMVEVLLYGRYTAEAPKFRRLGWSWSPLRPGQTNPFSETPGVDDEALHYWQTYREELLAIWRAEGNAGPCWAERLYGRRLSPVDHP